MGLVSIFKRWQTGQTGRRELDSLGPDELDALARDIGIPGEVLASVAARGPNAGAELPRLMEALSLDPDRVAWRHGTLMRDMSVTCSQCDAAPRCRRDLDAGRAEATYAEYCPNAETLQELRRENDLPRH